MTILLILAAWLLVGLLAAWLFGVICDGGEL